MHEFFDDILPHPSDVDPDNDLIHERSYIVRAYKRSDTMLQLRGAVRDQKPPGLYVPGDTEPMTVHHMILDLHIEIPSLVITDAHAVMEVHPNRACPGIEPKYEQLVGLSIARGFTHTIRSLFGGPRGCTHITALLQAMAPVAVQAVWSYRAIAMRNDNAPERSSEENRNVGLAMNMNTCHVWAEDGEHVQLLRSGGEQRLPLWITKRYEQLGRDPKEFLNRG